jgi:type II secretory pathway pseudopilin PulG
MAQRFLGHRGLGRTGIVVAIAAALVVVVVMGFQLVAVNQRNNQLTAALSASQVENTKLAGNNQRLTISNQTMTANGASLATQNADLQRQVVSLQSKLGSVLADERVGKAFFESFLGMLNGSHYAESCSQAAFSSSGLRNECAYVESYYDQIDVIALPYLGK